MFWSHSIEMMKFMLFSLSESVVRCNIRTCFTMSSLCAAMDFIMAVLFSSSSLCCCACFASHSATALAILSSSLTVCSRCFIVSLFMILSLCFWASLKKQHHNFVTAREPGIFQLSSNPGHNICFYIYLNNSVSLSFLSFIIFCFANKKPFLCSSSAFCFCLSAALMRSLSLRCSYK